MDIYTILIIIAGFALLATKSFDVHSTLKNIQSVEHESNPLASALMDRFGIRRTIWGIFVFFIVIALSAVWVAMNLGVWFKILFIGYGLFLSVVQAAVARANYTGEQNWITLLVMGYFYGVSRLRLKIGSWFRR